MRLHHSCLDKAQLLIQDLNDCEFALVMTEMNKFLTGADCVRTAEHGGAVHRFHFRSGDLKGVVVKVGRMKLFSPSLYFTYNPSKADEKQAVFGLLGLIASCITLPLKRLRVNRIDFASDLVVDKDKLIVRKVTGNKTYRAVGKSGFRSLYIGSTSSTANHLRVYDKLAELKAKNSQYPVCLPDLDRQQLLLRVELSLKYRSSLHDLIQSGMQVSGNVNEKVPDLRRQLALVQVMEWQELCEGINQLKPKYRVPISNAAERVWQALSAPDKLLFGMGVRQGLLDVGATTKLSGDSLWRVLNGHLNTGTWKERIAVDTHNAFEREFMTEIASLVHAVNLTARN